MRTYGFFFRGWLSIALLLVGLTTFAQEQTSGISLEQFQPAFAGDRFFGVASPYAAGDPGIHVHLLGDYAHNPLVLTKENGDNIGAVVSDQLWLHLNGSVALWRKFAFNIDVPVALVQSGDSPSGGGTTYASPSSAEFGDLRLGVRVVLFGEQHDSFQVGLGGLLWVPTGASDSFTSDGGVRGSPHLILGGEAHRFIWSATLGPMYRPSQSIGNIAQGTSLLSSVGGGWLFGQERQFQLGTELSLSTLVEGAEERNTSSELLLGAKYQFLNGFDVGVAMGPGLSSGVGTPDFRAVAQVGFHLEKKRPDRDKDGVFDDEDACVDEPGLRSADPKKNGCPPPKDSDKDGVTDNDDACIHILGIATSDPATNGCPRDSDRDGIYDSEDACVHEPGVKSEDPKKNGCPLPKDSDGDGVVDPEDACIAEPGVRTDDSKTNGCPADTDADGIINSKDACPNEKGKPNPDPSKNGCPDAVRVTETEIVILQQVQFDTNKTTIRKESDALLNEVAEVLKQHDEIKLIEVQGHTDTKGSKKGNQKLSEGRADAVRKALIAYGIDTSRLQSKGYGQEVPIADNSTEEGRQKNRRVQFKILSKK